MKSTLAITLCVSFLSAGCCAGTHETAHAVGSIAYHASPAQCSITRNGDKAIKELPRHDSSRKGKGLVFEAIKPGKALIACGNTKTWIEVREAVEIELGRIDGDDGAIADDALYLPGLCMRAYDAGGEELEIGRHTEAVEFTTSDHIKPIGREGLSLVGFTGDATCLRQHTPHRRGRAIITVAWRGMTARTSIEIEAAD